jgi:acetoin utilization protein AcuC
MRMTDGQQPWPRPFDQGFNPTDPVDAAILATRVEVFPHWGLTPEPDLAF